MKTKLLAFAVATLLSSGAVASITITSNNVVARVSDNGTAFVRDFFFGTSIPASTLLHAEIPGNPNFYSDIQVDYTELGGQTVLSHIFDQQREGTQYDYSDGYDSSLYFTADTNTTYELAGSYGVTDVNEPGRVFLRAYLRDQTTGQNLFFNYQDSRVTSNESFVLGETEGDFGDSLEGSLTGNLIAGHTYRWYSHALTLANPNADSGASAAGFVSLTIGEAVAPEPTALLVWSLLGLAAVGVGGNRRR